MLSKPNGRKRRGEIMLSKVSKSLLVTSAVVVSSAGIAANCSTVRFSDVGWTDITATSAVTT